jgi:hypothetical protein
MEHAVTDSKERTGPFPSRSSGPSEAHRTTPGAPLARGMRTSAAVAAVLIAFPSDSPR